MKPISIIFPVLLLAKRIIGSLTIKSCEEYEVTLPNTDKLPEISKLPDIVPPEDDSFVLATAKALFA